MGLNSVVVRAFCGIIVREFIGIKLSGSRVTDKGAQTTATLYGILSVV